MNKANWTHTGGMPARQNLFGFIQDGIAETFKNMAKSKRIAGSYGADQKPVYGSAYIVYGCTITNNGDGTASVTEGAVFFNNEIYTVPAHSIALSVSLYVVYSFEEDIADDPAGVREYFDGDSHATQQIRQAKLGFEVYPDSTAYNIALFTKLTTRVAFGGNTAIQNRDYHVMYTEATPLRTGNILAGGGGWQTSHSGGLFYKRDARGLVTVACSLWPVSGNSTSGLICTLPLGYRPTSNVYAFSRFNTGEGQNEYVKIGTDGTCRVQLENGTEAYGNKPVTFMVQYQCPQW